MTKFRYGFLRSISLSALVAGSAFAADSKPAATAASPAALEEVVVTGIRASLQSAMDAKRDSIQIIDAISAEDIGKFPDKNLGEALQRVTGVQISRADGEGRNVTVRGSEASQIRVEINGSTALSVSPNAGDRAVDFRDLPVEFVSRLEVVKTPTADMTEGGIATVRVITRRPFDSTEPYIAGSIQGVYSNLAEKTDPKVALIGSRLFLDNTLGVLLSTQYEKRHLYDATANTTGWLRFAAASTPAVPVCNAAASQGTVGAQSGARRNDFNQDGVCDWYPQIPRYINNRRETDREAFSSVVEWRPMENFKLYWDTTYARGKESVNNTLLQLNGSGGQFDYSKTTVGADNTVSHIELTSNGATGSFPLDLSYRNILGELTRTQYVTALGTKWDVGEQVTVDGRVDYSHAVVFNNETDSTAQLFGMARAVVDYTGSLGAPNITFPGLDVTNAAGINRLDSVHVPVRDTSADKQGTFNVEYRPANVGWLKLKAGVQRHEYEITQDQYSKTVRLNCKGDTSSGSIIAVTTSCATITGLIGANSTINPIPFFKTGDLGFANGTRYWIDNTDATVAAMLAAAGAVNPLGGNLDVYGANPNANTNGTFRAYTSNWTVSEKTTSWYGQAQFNFPEIKMPVSGTIGLRYVDTKTNSTGYTQQTAGTVVTFPITSIDGGYKQALPSFNLKLGLIPDELIARFAAAKVMARPAPSQLALARRLDIVGLTDIRGNPDLLPFLSTNYDAGMEWYFSKTSFVSAALFRKEIARFIIQTTTPEVLDGIPYSVTLPINGTDKVTVDGIEVGVQYAFDFLPAPLNGFGVLANYTYQKDKGFKGVNQIDGTALSFPGLSRNSYNYSLYYENAKFNARVSYNWRSRWLINASGRGNLPEFNDAYGQMDASAGYNITPHLSLFLEGVNLTNQQLVQENAPARPIQFETFGKRYFVGIRGKF
jgi:iron complex outermembrane recepter protein